jgi:hypothetical protein
MLMLSEPQIEIVMTAAGGLPAEKRGLFVERIAARLRLGGTLFTDADLDVSSPRPPRQAHGRVST